MMKTADVNKDLIGRRCECISLGMVVTGVIEDIALTKYTARVKVRYDEPQRRGQEILYSGWSQGDKGGGTMVAHSNTPDCCRNPLPPTMKH